MASLSYLQVVLSSRVLQGFAGTRDGAPESPEWAVTSYNHSTQPAERICHVCWICIQENPAFIRLTVAGHQVYVLEPIHWSFPYHLRRSWQKRSGHFLDSSIYHLSRTATISSLSAFIVHPVHTESPHFSITCAPIWIEYDPKIEAVPRDPI